MNKHKLNEDSIQLLRLYEYFINHEKLYEKNLKYYPLKLALEEFYKFNEFYQDNIKNIISYEDIGVFTYHDSLMAVIKINSHSSAVIKFYYNETTEEQRYSGIFVHKDENNNEYIAKLKDFHDYYGVIDSEMFSQWFRLYAIQADNYGKVEKVDDYKNIDKNTTSKFYAKMLYN